MVRDLAIHFKDILRKFHSSLKVDVLKIPQEPGGGGALL